MTTVNFTKGPWKVNSFNSGVSTDYVPDSDRTSGYGAGNDFICDLNDGEYHEYHNNEEQIANAHLIAAAPELYEALEAAANSSGFQYMFSDTRDKINAALAKARGEQK